MDAYAKDGVNVAVGDSFSAFAARVCAETSSPFITVKDWSKGHFRGPRSFKFKHLPNDVEFDIGADGIGTKVVVITEAMSHSQAAIDVLAMTCTDVTRWGGKPLMFSNVLDVATLGADGTATQKLFRDAIIGLAQAAKQQGILAYRGETAELGACVGSENPDAVTKFNWAGFALGAYDPKRVITGAKMRPGDIVVALQEKGFRSNGMSSVRAALRERFGEKWWENSDARPAIRAAARQSVIYDRFLTWANGWDDIPSFTPPFAMKCIAHISGGGIPSKFGEDILFRQGLSATLD
jgi:phosphoribosylaminoimidazole (AIR) synthetase